MDVDLLLVLSLKAKFSCCDFKWVPWSKNNHADSLANMASTTEFLFQREILVEPDSEHPAARGGDLLLRHLARMDPIIAYLKDSTLPDDKTEA